MALLPQVKQEYAASAREKAARARLSLLQRALHLVLGRVMEASHHGCMIRLVDGSEVCISPRLIVYACDYPEERSVMCLKHHGGKYDCTQCLAPTGTYCTQEGMHGPERPVLPTVSAQLQAADLVATLGHTARVAALEKKFGIKPCVPALAGWAGLGSGPMLLYKMPGFDQLHVRFCGPFAALSSISCGPTHTSSRALKLTFRSTRLVLHRSLSWSSTRAFLKPSTALLLLCSCSAVALLMSFYRMLRRSWTSECCEWSATRCPCTWNGCPRNRGQCWYTATSPQQ